MQLYRLDASAAQISATFGVDAGDDPWTGGYVTPGRPAPVIAPDSRGGPRRYLRPKLWGVPPPPQGRQPVATVRNLTSPFWIGTLRHPELRCLIPVTSFAVWSGPAGVKRQRWASVPGRPIFAFAGIQRQTEDWPGFAVLTTDPNGLLERLAPVAMPLILHAEDHERWLTADWRDAVHLVTPFPSHLMTVDDTYPYP